MSFGFSVGDFIAVGKLTGDIISSLQAVGGAKSEYQELIRELQSLQTALRYLDRLDDTNSPGKHVQSIKCAALACSYPLESFLAKIRKYEASLGLWSRSHTAKTVKDKLCWTFGEKGEVIKLRAYLSMHIETTNNMLIQHGLERMDLLGKAAEEGTSQLQLQLDNTQKALATIQKDTAGQAIMLRKGQAMLGTLCKVVSGEIKSTLQQLSQAVTTVCVSTQQIYAVVLEIRNSVSSVDTRFTYFQAPYQVEDARGFVFPVPSEFSLDELENIIVHKFRVGAGSQDVQEGNYELCNTKKRSERVIATTSLQPGMAITMAIIITKAATGYGDSVCPMPHCESFDIAVSRGGGFRCRDCDVWFDQASKKRKRPRIDEVHDIHFSDTEDTGQQRQVKRARTETADAVMNHGTNGIKNVTLAAASRSEDQTPKTTEAFAQDNAAEKPIFAPTIEQSSQFTPYEIDIKTESQLFINDVPKRRDSTISTFNSNQTPHTFYAFGNKMTPARGAPTPQVSVTGAPVEPAVISSSISPHPLSIFRIDECEDSFADGKPADAGSQNFDQKEIFHPSSVPIYASTYSNLGQHHNYISASSHAAFPQSEDRYICQTCNKVFSRPSSLRIHSYSHMGEKPYKCTRPGCGKAFSVQSNMRRHERGCHGIMAF